MFYWKQSYVYAWTFYTKCKESLILNLIWQVVDIIINVSEQPFATCKWHGNVVFDIHKWLLRCKNKMLYSPHHIKSLHQIWRYGTHRRKVDWNDKTKPWNRGSVCYRILLCFVYFKWKLVAFCDTVLYFVSQLINCSVVYTLLVEVFIVFRDVFFFKAIIEMDTESCTMLLISLSEHSLDG